MGIVDLNPLNRVDPFADFVEDRYIDRLLLLDCLAEGRLLIQNFERFINLFVVFLAIFHFMRDSGASLRLQPCFGPLGQI